MTSNNRYDRSKSQ